MEQINALLRAKGYTILSHSVNNKSQKEKVHMIVEKDNIKYFVKFNVGIKQKILIENELFVAKYLKENFGKYNSIDVIAPINEFEYMDHIVLIYPFFEGKFISNQENRLEDFSISKDDYSRAIELITKSVKAISDLIILTPLDKSKGKKKSIDQMLEKISIRLENVNIYKSSEILATLKSMSKYLELQGLAIHDLQYQNMSWDPSKKRLYLLDLELVQQRPLHWDAAHLYTLSIINSSKSIMFAESFIKYYVHSFPKKDQNAVTQHLRISAILICIYYLDHFLDDRDRLIKTQKYVDLLLNGTWFNDKDVKKS